MVTTALRNISRTHDARAFGTDAALADFMKTAIPLGVGSANGLEFPAGASVKDPIAFQMKSPDGAKKIDLAWDKASDKLYVLQNGKMIEASPAVRTAALERLTQQELIGKRTASTYSQMRDDMVRTRTSSVEPRKVPPEPRTEGKFEYPKTEQTVSKTEQPVAKTEQTVAKTEQTVAKTEQTVAKTEQPVAKTEQTVAKTEQTVAKTAEPLPKIMREDFLTANGKRTVSTEELRKQGFHAKEVRDADRNGDGAISGNEWADVWSKIDARDTDGKSASVDPNNEKSFPAVKKRLDAVAQAKDSEAPYTKDDLEYSQQLMSLYPRDGGKVTTLSNADADKKGLPRGTARIALGDGGNASNDDVAIYRTPDGAWYKELNAADSKNTPVVRLTPAEKKILDENTFLSDSIHPDNGDSRSASYQLAREFGGAGG